MVTRGRWSSGSGIAASSSVLSFSRIVGDARRKYSATESVHEVVSVPAARVSAISRIGDCLKRRYYVRSRNWKYSPATVTIASWPRRVPVFSSSGSLLFKISWKMVLCSVSAGFGVRNAFIAWACVSYSECQNMLTKKSSHIRTLFSVKNIA